MKTILISALTFSSLIFTSLFAHAAFDALGTTTATFQSENPDSVLGEVTQDLKSVFEKLQVRTDSSTTVVSPLQVGGTAQEPTVQITLKKCVFIACETVALDAVMKLEESTGNCQKNFFITADLRRSSDILTKYYQNLQFQACFNANGNEGKVDLNGSAVQAESFQKDMYQKEIFKMLQMQLEPIGTALQDTLKEKANQ